MVKFQSRKDPWLTVTMWSSITLMLAAGVFPFFESEGGWISDVIIMILLWGASFFLCWMWLTTAYVLQEDHLLIRFGPFRKIIPYDSIRSIIRTASILSAPALSTRRLEIRFNRFDIAHISPADEERMLELLRERCPQASIEP